MDDFRSSYSEWLTKHLLATGQRPDDLDYKRGFLAGMKHVVRYPGLAEKSLERAIAKSQTEGDA